MRLCNSDAGPFSLMIVSAEGAAVYGRTEIRNNRAGKQLAAKQVVKTSEARNVPLKDSRSQTARRGRRSRGEAGVYRASVGRWCADLQMPG